MSPAQSLAQTLAHARVPLASFAAMGVLWGTFAACLPDVKAMLGVAEAELGLVLLPAPVAAVTTMLLAPRIGAALGRVALPSVTLAMALAFTLPGQAGSLAFFGIAMACCGAATGALDVLMNARVSALEAERGTPLMNLTHAAYSFGYAGGALATGVMRGAAWEPFAVLGTAAFAGCVLALLTAERNGRIEGLVRAKGTVSLPLGLVPLIGGGIVLIAFLTENAAENWSALHIEQTLGGSPTEGALGPAVLALTMGTARLGGQWIAARLDALVLLRGGAVIAALGAMIAALAGSAPVAYAGFVVMGIGASVLAPTAFSYVGQMAEPAVRARAVARATICGYFGYFIGPPGLGFVAGAFGLRAAFVFAACALALVIGLTLLLARRRGA